MTPQCHKGRPPLIKRAALSTYLVIIKCFSCDENDCGTDNCVGNDDDDDGNGNHDDGDDDDDDGNDNDGKSRL